MRPVKEIKFRGEVVKRPYAVGSKSEHEAVCLLDAKGRTLRLRLLGGDPFHDPALEALVGKTIAGRAEQVHGNTLIVSAWTETPR